MAASVELGYATTIHGAQGVTADTCHGLLTGTESRQQAYTMLSRGRYANHAWVQVSNVDHHTAPVAQNLVEPSTATQLLETVVERDDAPVSVTTLLAQANDPVRLLGPAVTCYLDAIGFAAERHLDQATEDAIDAAGQARDLTDADAWPTLHSHLMLIAANGHDPGVVLAQAAALGGLETARDPATRQPNATPNAASTTGWTPPSPESGNGPRASSKREPALAGDPRLPVLAAKLATLATTRPDAVRILHIAARMGGLPDDHPADALDYRITNFIKRTAASPSTWEAITPSDLARPRHPEPPPSLQPPDRSQGIRF